MTILKKTIYLIRHGETEFNKMGIVQGSGIDSDLNEIGRLQAKKFFETHQNVPFDQIYVSELRRTHQSVDPFSVKNIPFEIIPEFNEINWGILEGQKPSPEQKKLFTETVIKWRNNELNHSIANGESPMEMYNRQKNGLQRVLDSSHQHILICMHGRAMRSFLCLLTDTPLHQMDKFQHTNLCLYKLQQLESQKFTILLENDISHLS
jgi:probable phosphoglycerate mutase